MRNSELFIATGLLLAAVMLPGAAAARRYVHHHHHHYHRGLPYSISYLHNYGPGARPDSFAYYDGPSTNLCYRSSAAYIGQDHRRHPCF